MKVNIVGGGLAGQILAWKLFFRGVPFQIIDESYQRRPSNVAAGILNPITGRKYALSWKHKELLDEAVPFYRKIEDLTGENFFREMQLYRALPRELDAQNWELKAQDAPANEFMGGLTKKEDLVPGWRTETSLFGAVKQAYQLDIKGFCEISAGFWESKGFYQNAKYDPNALAVQSNKKSSSTTVLCEGASHKEYGRFFLKEIHKTKGDVLQIKCAALDQDRIIKDRYFICPLFEKDLFWVGSNYEHEAQTDAPSPSWKEKLIDFLDTKIPFDYKVVQHISAYRPTVVDRRPIIGAHPVWNDFYIFNGLGTKGASLGPWTASRLVNHMLEGQAIPAAVDLQRFVQETN